MDSGRQNDSYFNILFYSKLTNIFSKKFEVETVDQKEKKKLSIVWKDNMSTIESLDIRESNEDSYTEVTFQPDLQKFGLKTISEDI